MKIIFFFASLTFFMNLWASDHQEDYQDQFRRLALAMQFSSEQVMDSSEYGAPKGSYDLRQFFLRLCSLEAKGSQSFEKNNIGQTEEIVFNCDEVKSNASIQGWRFTGLLNSDNKLLKFRLEKVSAQKDKAELSEGLKVSAALGAGLLASSFLSRTLYPNEDDKLLHFYAGDIIAAGSMLVSYYGLKLNKDKSLLVGLGMGILAGIAKEVYDSRNPDKHVKDKNDALATFGGAGLGVGTLRLAFEF